MTNMSAKMINSNTPAGYTLVNRKALVNPANPSVVGALHRIDATGMYVLLAAGCAMSCPQGWARDNDDTISK